VQNFCCRTCVVVVGAGWVPNNIELSAVVLVVVVVVEAGWVPNNMELPAVILVVVVVVGAAGSKQYRTLLQDLSTVWRQ